MHCTCLWPLPHRHATQRVCVSDTVAVSLCSFSFRAAPRPCHGASGAASCLSRFCTSDLGPARPGRSSITAWAASRAACAAAVNGLKGIVHHLGESWAARECPGIARGLPDPPPQPSPPPPLPPSPLPPLSGWGLGALPTTAGSLGSSAAASCLSFCRLARLAAISATWAARRAASAAAVNGLKGIERRLGESWAARECPGIARGLPDPPPPPSPPPPPPHPPLPPT
jgi:hypothetical protein